MSKDYFLHVITSWRQLLCSNPASSKVSMVCRMQMQKMRTDMSFLWVKLEGWVHEPWRITRSYCKHTRKRRTITTPVSRLPNCGSIKHGDHALTFKLFGFEVWSLNFRDSSPYFHLLTSLATSNDQYQAVRDRWSFHHDEILVSLSSNVDLSPPGDQKISRCRLVIAIGTFLLFSCQKQPEVILCRTNKSFY